MPQGFRKQLGRGGRVFLFQLTCAKCLNTMGDNSGVPRASERAAEYVGIDPWRTKMGYQQTWSFFFLLFGQPSSHLSKVRNSITINSAIRSNLISASPGSLKFSTVFCLYGTLPEKNLIVLHSSAILKLYFEHMRWILHC